jgi:hypothetical protein
MTCVEFKLAMPNRGSWDNRWSGESRNYTLVKDFDDELALQLDGRSWSYSWPDGWRAEISARLVHEAATQPPSHGFHGYDWMVESILRYDKIYADHEQPEAVP